MFTGIIESTGKIEKIDREGKNIKLTLSSNLSSELRVDESLSHNGVCLTVTDCNKNFYSVTIIDESLKKTNFSSVKVGSQINLERSLKIDGRLDGHIVQGHVDDIAKCIKKIDQENSWLFTFEFSEKFSDLIIEKGSICINGVSLTCFDTSKNNFTVAIIPHTYDNTNFKLLDEGDYVNLEFDILGKYIKKIIRT
ncbi:MAG: riboflavin synthase [Flammeovirgaceae bacterium]|nr:riboflavin synthase [Flammeovirgaceae bacterium]|tara:strand:- start:636 stop:1220 length:585 start_codon:yes stop_codon:yes gene_type:complete